MGMYLCVYSGAWLVPDVLVHRHAAYRGGLHLHASRHAPAGQEEVGARNVLHMPHVDGSNLLLHGAMDRNNRGDRQDSQVCSFLKL